MSLLRRPVVVLAWIASVYLVSDWGRHALDDVDGLYVHIARQMFERGDWITPYADGVRFGDKPPLMFWLMALSYRLLGPTEFASRLPFDLALVCTAWLLWRMGRLAGDPEGGSWSALCFALCVGTFLFTRTTEPDMLVILFDTLALSSFLEWYRGDGGPTPAALRFYAALAGAVLSKGLIGLVMPLGTVRAFLAWKGDLGRLGRARLLRGVLLFLAIAAPWFVLVAWRNPGFLWHFFVDEHVLRFLGLRQPHDYQSISVTLFWLLMVVWLLPWSPFLPAAIAVSTRAGRLEPPLRDLVCLAASWALVALVFFSISSRLEHYALAVLPPVAILLGVALSLGTRAEGTKSDWVGGGFRALGIAGAILGVGLVGATLWLADPSSVPGSLGRGTSGYTTDFGPLFHLPPPLLARLSPLLLLTGLTIGIGGPGSLALYRSRGHPRWAALGVAGMATVFCLLAAASLGACEGVLSSWEFGEALAKLCEPGDAVVVLGDYETANSLGVYAPMPLLVFEGKAPVLEWGERFPDAPKRILSRDGFLSRWGGPLRTFLLVPDDQLAGLPPGPYHEILRSEGRTLVCNRPLGPNPRGIGGSVLAPGRGEPRLPGGPRAAALQGPGGPRSGP